MKNKKIIIILIGVLILIGMIVIVFNITKGSYHNAKYMDITYQEEHDDYACITFYKNGKYSMYDCDSEPTPYFFDNENECTYSYDGKKYISFNCKYKTYKFNNSIKVLEWTKEKFIFEIDGEVKNFYAD